MYRCAEGDVCPIQVQVPRLHDHDTRAAAFQLGDGEVSDPRVFHHRDEAFQGVGAVIVSQVLAVFEVERELLPLHSLTDKHSLRDDFSLVCSRLWFINVRR